MGAGATGGFIATAAGSASAEELQNLFKGVPKDVRERFEKALKDLEGAPNASTVQTEPSADVDNALLELFQFYDLDKSGFVTIDEMLAMDRSFAKACGDQFNEEESRSCFKDSDANKDGKVALSEFVDKFKKTAKDAALNDQALIGMVKQTLDLMKEAKPAITLDDALTALFEIYDMDKSGFITIDETVAMDEVFSKAIQSPFNEAETRSNFTESDANKDNKVSLAEFSAYFKATGEKGGLGQDALLGFVRQTNEVMLKNKDK